MIKNRLVPPLVVILRKMDHIYSLLRGYGAATSKRLFLCVLNQFSSVLDHISPSQIDTIDLFQPKTDLFSTRALI